LFFASTLIFAACSSDSNEIAVMELGGRIVYSQGSEGLWEVDLQSGKISQLWELSEGGFLSDVAVSPDGLEVAMTYTPQTDSPIPRADIYIANADGSDAQPLLVHRGLYESFNHPTWSHDGQWIYFTRSDVLIDDVQGTGISVVNIERIPVGGGQPELVIEAAEQPHFSADGSRMTYLVFNEETSTRSLWVANADGSEPMESLPDTAFFDLTSPRLSPDGEMVAFAASGDLSSGAVPNRSFWSEHFGVNPAYAHGLPWDFYTISAKGGEITKLTSWGTDGTVLAWSPDGVRLALMHQGGLFVTGEDEDEPIMLAETPDHGGVDWAGGLQ
jgi:Tol biopolymer transport system component